jgi:hypothetical protein
VAMVHSGDFARDVYKICTRFQENVALSYNLPIPAGSMRF